MFSMEVNKKMTDEERLAELFREPRKRGYITKNAVKASLIKNNGNTAAVAKEFGISRGSMYWRIKEFGLKECGQKEFIR